MSLFNPNGPDAGLHYLTHWAQAENIEEIEVLTRRWDRVAGRRWKAVGFNAAKIDDELIQRIARIHAASVPFLRGIVTGEDVAVEDVLLVKNFLTVSLAPEPYVATTRMAARGCNRSRTQPPSRRRDLASSLVV